MTKCLYNVLPTGRPAARSIICASLPLLGKAKAKAELLYDQRRRLKRFNLSNATH